MKRQSHFFQNKIDKKQTVFVSAIYDYDDHTPSFNYGDLALAAEDMIEVTDTTFVCNIHHPATKKPFFLVGAIENADALKKWKLRYIHNLPLQIFQLCTKINLVCIFN
jgi:hypothetical protein